MTRFLDWLLNRRPAPVAIKTPPRYEWTPTYSRDLAARLLAVGMGDANGGRR